LSWGRSQTRDTAGDPKRRADESQEVWKARFEAKRKAAEKGEDIKQRLGETEDEFRNRIAKATTVLSLKNTYGACPPKK
jgi:hypothetical protein